MDQWMNGPIDGKRICRFSNRFCKFYKSITDQRTNGPTDQQTDLLSYRDTIAASCKAIIVMLSAPLKKTVSNRPDDYEYR